MLTYTAYTGWYFVGAVTDTQRLAYVSSWGLLDTAGTAIPVTWWKGLLIGARRLGWIG